MKNWKTTLAGFILAAMGIVTTAIQAYQDGKPINWLHVAICIAFAGFSLLLKDFDVTGVGSKAMSAKDVSKTLSVMLFAGLLVGCASTQFVSATASNGDQFAYCLEATFPLNPFQANTLFCGGLSKVQAEQAKEAALHPDVTYSIVPQRRVAK